MKKIFKNKDFVKTAVSGVIITIAVIVLSLKRGHTPEHAICDGFFVSGVLLLCYAGLIFSTHQGMFDIFKYGVSHWLHIRWPWAAPLDEEYKDESYGDYRVRVSKNRKYPFGVLIAAGIFDVLAIITFIVYLASC